MLKKLKSSNKGFTIIEVLIVLAIAALILLIVFLAVPALQRNSRNTQRSNDVAGLLAAVAEAGNNNNGTLPDKCTGTSPITFDTTAAGYTTAEAKVGYMNKGCAAGAASVNGHVGIVGPGNIAPLSTTSPNDWVTIATGDACKTTTTTDDSAQAGPTRGVVAIYQTEIGGGKYASVCKAS